ncbi:MAG TPA: hypothetical protein VL137_17145 [Polyangiaceae bacterium]|nr:hypothetical protein [Polyangiaceae bacterium]
MIASSRIAAVFLCSALTCALNGCGTTASTPTNTATAATPAGGQQEMAPARKPAHLATAAVFVGCGFLYAGNAGQVPFSVFLAARDAEKIPRNDHLLVLDGILMEVQSTTAEEIGTSARGKELLLEHQRWELEYTSQSNHWPDLTPSSASIDLQIPGIDAIAWAYAVPSAVRVLGEPIDRMMYVTAAIEDAVFVLAVPLRPGDDPAVPAERTWNIIATIKRLDRGLDPLAISQQIKTSHEVWKDCRTGI